MVTVISKRAGKVALTRANARQAKDLVKIFIRILLGAIMVILSKGKWKIFPSFSEFQPLPCLWSLKKIYVL